MISHHLSILCLLIFIYILNLLVFLWSHKKDKAFITANSGAEVCVATDINLSWSDTMRRWNQFRWILESHPINCKQVLLFQINKSVICFYSLAVFVVNTFELPQNHFKTFHFVVTHHSRRKNWNDIEVEECCKLLPIELGNKLLIINVNVWVVFAIKVIDSSA